MRNSGARAVIAGTGDHGCEYMTGGTVLVLGEVGRNFAAGMSGGIAYVHAAKENVLRRLNLDDAHVVRCGDPDDAWLDRDREMLHRLLDNHVAHTGSERAKHLLRHWPDCLAEFVRVVPGAYAVAIEQFRANGRDVLPGLPPRAAHDKRARDEELLEVDE